MSDHPNSTTAPKSIGELTENIVDGLKMRREIASTMEDVIKAQAIVQTVWLALSSPSFDTDDVNAVFNTLSEAMETLGRIRSSVVSFNDDELREEIARRASR